MDQKGTDISISEIDLLGQTGDDIDFGQTDSIGLLKEDYHAGHGESGEAVIPAGSLLFTGTYLSLIHIFADRLPDREGLLAVHSICFDIHKELLKKYDFPTDIVFSRPNYCKICLLYTSTY